MKHAASVPDQIRALKINWEDNKIKGYDGIYMHVRDITEAATLNVMIETAARIVEDNNASNRDSSNP